MTLENKPAYLVIDFDVESLSKVDAFKSALAIALLKDDAAFVPEEQNDTIYATIKEGFHRVIARDTDVKDEILEDTIDGTLVLPQRVLERAIDVEATLLDADSSLQELTVTAPQEVEEEVEEQDHEEEVHEVEESEQDEQHKELSTRDLVKDLLPDADQMIDQLSEPLEVEPEALTSPNVVLLKSQLDTSLNQMQLLVDDQVSHAIRTGALQSSVQEVSQKLVEAPPTEILDYKDALEKQVSYREELNDQVDSIKESYNASLEAYIEAKIPELRAEYLATHPDDTDLRVAEFLAEHAHELVAIEESVHAKREKAEARVLRSVIENSDKDELRKLMKILNAKERYQSTLDNVVKVWRMTQGRPVDAPQVTIEPQHFEAPVAPVAKEQHFEEQVQHDTQEQHEEQSSIEEQDVDLSFLNDSSIDNIEAELHQRIENSAQQEREAHEQALAEEKREEQPAQHDVEDDVEDEHIDLEDHEDHVAPVRTPVQVPKIDYSNITASDDDEDDEVELDDADESDDNVEDTFKPAEQKPVEHEVKLDTNIGKLADEVESDDDEEIVEGAQSDEVDIDSMFEDLNASETVEEVTKPVKQGITKKTKLIAGGVTAGIVLLTAGGIYASQNLFNSPSQETTQQESTAAPQQDGETTLATTIVSVGDTLRVSVGGKEMNVKVIEVKADGSATVETPDGEKLAIPYESLKTLLDK
jgi:midasin, putative